MWCNFTDLHIHDGSYMGCHRYDQSALNLILTREFGLDAVQKTFNKKISNALWTIDSNKKNL